jgi:redox-sensitive bicupin YhaK (pirin superfamily)
MRKIRKIKKILKSKPTIEGAGVHLKRAFGYVQVPLLDPFLLLDDFHSDHPDDYIRGFPWHPHRGIETITTMLYGKVEHGDSMGNKGTISSGDVQWMTWQWDYSPGNAQRTERWVDVGFPTLGKSPGLP